MACSQLGVRVLKIVISLLLGESTNVCAHCGLPAGWEGRLSWLFFSFFVYMNVVYLYLCAHTCGDQRSALDAVPQNSTCLLFWERVSLDLELTDLDTLGIQPQGPSCRSLPHLAGYKHVPHAWLLTCVLWSNLGSHGCTDKAIPSPSSLDPWQFEGQAVGTNYSFNSRLLPFSLGISFSVNHVVLAPLSSQIFELINF